MIHLLPYLVAPVGSDLGGGLWSESPPTAPPRLVSVSAFDGPPPYVLVQVVPGDADAWTELGRTDDANTPPPSGQGIYLPPGTTAHVETDGLPVWWWARHTRGGTPSAWVRQ